MTGRRAGRCY